MIGVLELLTTTALGGGPRQVHDLVRHLPRAEFEAAVGAPRDGPYAERFERLGVPFAAISLGRLGPGGLAGALRLLRTRRPHVVHTHGKGAGFHGRLAARLAGVPAVHTFHGLHYESYPAPARRAYLALERWLARGTHTLVHVSASEAAEARALDLRPAGRAVVIPNGLDLAALDGARGPDRAALDIPRDALVLGCVARPDRVKRLDLLVEAFARLGPRAPRAWLLLVGPAADRAALQALAARARVAGRVTVAAADAGALPYRAMDVYVTASRKEGLPFAVLEAMAAALPVVATDVAGHRDAVVAGETGLLVPPDDAAALAEAMAAALADPAQRARLGRAGRARVAAGFTMSAMVAATAEVYRAAAAARRGA